MMFAEVAVAVPLYPHKKFFDYKIPAELGTELQVGQLVEVSFARRQTWAVVWKIKQQTTFEGDLSKIKEISSIIIREPLFNLERRLFAEWLCERYFYPIGEVVESMFPAAIRKASSKLLAKVEEKKVRDKALELKQLNTGQKKAFDGILNSNQKEHLLWGVTGSGKTEVYLHLIKEQLLKSKQSIVLVPEIALTPQLFSRFEKAFPGEVAVFHSSQTDKEQRSSWLDIFYGRKKIALGPRSALFAPVSNLGLIVVDEEHESSYKQEERLRYHARKSAQKLAELTGAKLLLGSATPSAETLHLALSGAMGLHKLEGRAVSKSVTPKISLVDLRKKIAQTSYESATESSEAESFPLAPESFFFSQELVSEIDSILKKGEQAILFLNRRGLGRARVCKKCGHQPTCLQCAVAMIPHKTKMLCHYCGFETPVPVQCEKCGSEMKELGFGTQALEETLAQLFPGIRSLRLDRDIVQDRKKLVETLDQFSKKEADVLIGTQMVAKGHDFPQVTLVGVILADIGFSMPDFRGEEKAYQLLTQVSGRAGRAEIPGKVIVQSFRPEDKVFQSLSKGESLSEYETLMTQVLETRKLLKYPPFSELAMLQFQGMELAKVEAAARLVANALEKIKVENFSALGAVPSPIVKIRNKYRYQILLKAENFSVLEKALHWVQEKWIGAGLEKKFADTRMLIDVDPVGMM